MCNPVIYNKYLCTQHVLPPTSLDIFFPCVPISTIHKFLTKANRRALRRMRYQVYKYVNMQ